MIKALPDEMRNNLLPLPLQTFIRAGSLLLAVWTGGIALTLLLGAMLPRGSGELAFAAALDNDLDIYRMDVDRRLLRPITFNEAADFQPAWSPDGQQIAFVSDRSGKYELYLMQADGTQTRRLTIDPARVYSPAWSPDGKQIVYVTEQLGYGYTELMLLEVATGCTTRLTNDNAADTSPSWSPDGRRIAFASDRDISADFNIYVMNADGSDVQVLEATPGDDLTPAWSPDGRYLIYTTDFSNMAIFVADLETGKAAPLFTNNFVGNDTPNWSPDGRYISYLGMDSSSQGFTVIYLLDTACVATPSDCPATIRRLNSGSAMYLNPRWRPG